uniref:Reverse transcriptase Ty1/copia-type domain-containing protein n=1 Tax=Solanum lycopersicum TaxID=4081 RepID=A0A3Q7HBK1_SOLLC
MPHLTGIHQEEPYKGVDHLKVGNGASLSIHHTTFSNDHRVFFEFYPAYFPVKDQATRKVLLSGPSKDDLDTLLFKLSSTFRSSAYLSAKASKNCWHIRLGHPHKQSFIKSSNMFYHFLRFVKNQFNTTIKSIQTDGGGEFCVLTPVLNKQWILHWLSCHHTHEQQAKVEQKHGHIVETGSDSEFLDNIILRLGYVFAFKDLGPLNLFVGIQVERTKSGLSLYQHHYISSLLERAK